MTAGYSDGYFFLKAAESNAPATNGVRKGTTDRRNGIFVHLRSFRLFVFDATSRNSGL